MESSVKEFTVTIVRTMRTSMPADTEAEALMKAEAVARRGKYDARRYSQCWEDRPPLILAIPWRSEAQEMIAVLEMLKKAETARWDPKVDAAQRRRAARELAAAAMRIIRREKAGADHREVTHAAELAFQRAKSLARILWDSQRSVSPDDVDYH
jgi:hypothetical protein